MARREWGVSEKGIVSHAKGIIQIHLGVVRLIHIHRTTSSTSIGNDLHRCIAVRYIVPCYLLCYSRAVDIGEGRGEGRNREKETSVVGNPPIQYERLHGTVPTIFMAQACGHSVVLESVTRTLPTTRS